MGVKAIDEQTLVVHLEHPVPYFLELTSYVLYFPISRYTDIHCPNWSEQRDEQFVCNGPFRLKAPDFGYAFELEKNPYYWEIK